MKLLLFALIALPYPIIWMQWRRIKALNVKKPVMNLATLEGIYDAIMLRDDGKNLEYKVRACFLVTERLELENTARKEIWAELDACEQKARELLPKIETLQRATKRALRTGLAVKPLELQQNEEELHMLQELLSEVYQRMRRLRELAAKIW